MGNISAVLPRNGGKSVGGGWGREAVVGRFEPRKARIHLSLVSTQELTGVMLLLPDA